MEERKQKEWKLIENDIQIELNKNKQLKKEID